jgi:hypothetical protein
MTEGFQHLHRDRGLRTLAGLLLAAASALAADWLTFSGDPQRTGWAKAEVKITKENVKDLKVEWKLKLDTEMKEMYTLTAPVIVENMFTARGVKDIVVVAGASDTIHGIDADSGKLMWRKQMTAEGKPRNPPHWLCPNALNATPVIDKKSRTVYTIASDGKLYTLNVMNGEDRVAPIQFVPPYSKNWSLNLVNNVIYTTTGQGCNGAKSGVYSIDIGDPNRPIVFFASTTTGGAGIWGRAGAAVGLSGMVFAETGDGAYDLKAGKYADTFLGLSPKELKLVDYYTPENRAWITKKDLDLGCMSPVVFPFKNWELVAGGGKEGVLYLLDAKQLGGENHRTPLFRSPLWTNEDVDFAGRGFWGALSTWEDAEGVRWLYAPALGPPTPEAKFPTSYGETPNGSIMAFKVEEKEGKPVLVPAWNSRDLKTAPEPVIVANGMVFALASGENPRQVDSGGRLLTSKERIENLTGRAVLYVLDAATGKELYSSGELIEGWTHFGGLGMSNGRVYVATSASTVFAFGLGE